MGHTTTGDDTAGLDQLCDHGDICFTLFTLAIENFQTCEKRHMGQKFAGLANVMGHPVGPTALDKTVIIVGTVAWGGMHKAGSGLFGDVIAVDHWNVVRPKIIQSG